MSQYNYKKIKTDKPVTSWQEEPDLESESEEVDDPMDVEELVERFENCLSQLEELIAGLKLNTQPTISL